MPQLCCSGVCTLRSGGEVPRDGSHAPNLRIPLYSTLSRFPQLGSHIFLVLLACGVEVNACGVVGQPAIAQLAVVIGLLPVTVPSLG